MKLTISCKLWNDLISAWWNKIKPCAHVLFTLDGAIPELRGYWTPVRDFVSITPRIESLFWALSWRGQDFRMFLSVEVLRNLPFVQSRNRPFMLFSYSCIPRDAWKGSPHFQTSVSMVDLQAMFFASVSPQVVARQPFYENFTKFLQWLEKSLGICEEMEREKTNGKGTDVVSAAFPRCAVFCLETKLKTACIVVKVVWWIHKI